MYAHFSKQSTSPFVRMYAIFAIVSLVLSLVQGVFTVAHANDVVETTEFQDDPTYGRSMNDHNGHHDENDDENDDDENDDDEDNDENDEDENDDDEDNDEDDDDSDNDDEDHTIRICHIGHNDDEEGDRDFSIEVDTNSIIRNAGHSGHESDIIPPFTYGKHDQFSYPGKNWDEVGEAIWRGLCRFTARVTVTKIVNNEAGGTAVVGDFDLFVGDRQVESGVTKRVRIGNHVVTEEGPSGYQASFSGSCDSEGNIRVRHFQKNECVITNTFVPVPVDLCLNIDGVQTEVPKGYVRDEAGNCTEIPPPPVDQCPNLEGTQSTIPEGYVKNEAGDCVLANPADLCPNIEGTQTVMPEGYVINEVGQCVLHTPICSVTLVSGTDSTEDGSDDYTTVVEKDGALAKLLSYIHPAWTASIPSARWIWGDNPVAQPVNNQTQTFERKFGWTGPVESAVLTLATDNSFVASLNTDSVAIDNDEVNFATAQVYDVSGLIDQGNNALSVAVLNLPSSEDPSQNPAGLMYKLVVTGSSEQCSVPYEEEVFGCTDPEAENYDPKATNDDESCVYDDGDDDGPSCTAKNSILTNGSFESPAIESDWTTLDQDVTPFNWDVTSVALSTDALLEFERGVFGWLSSEGAQHVELDGNEPVSIAQTVATVPGTTYALSFDYSPRPGTGVADNELEVRADGVALDVLTVDGSLLSNTAWANHSYSFVATGATTEVRFTDLGDANTLGTMLDNVLLCATDEVIDPDTNQIEGYVWIDTDEDGEWDEGEMPASGWMLRVVNTENSEDAQATTSDAEGYFGFRVADGEWLLSEDVEEGWEQTYPEGGTYTISFGGSSMMARTLVMSTPQYNFGNVAIATTPTDGGSSSNGGGGGVRQGSKVNRDTTGQGGSLVEPEGEVLGASTSVMPVGAPNTGAGGASSTSTATAIAFLLMGISLMIMMRTSKHG